MLFTDLQLIEPVLKALQQEGYTQPTPIQQKAIPVVLQRRDLLGCAQTGTGKTAAFAIPLLQLMNEHQPQPGARRPIRTLVLTPTRELAIQIDESFRAYGRHLPLKTAVIFGGVSQHSQVSTLRAGIDILVATPGRLLDLMQQQIIHLQDIQFFVLDEADRMLDMGFVHDVKKVIAKLPAKKQSLFFSATMPPQAQQLADMLLHNPAKVEVAPVSSTADTIQQAMYFVDKKNKPSLLTHLLEDSSIVTSLVFTRTKHGADKVAKHLNRSGVRAEAIHGNKSQNARQAALSNFKTSRTRVLVATDIAARGIDIDELGHVINFDLPNVPETYVHRIGRTGRAGASGKAVSFCDYEEKPFLKDIEKLIRKSIPVVHAHPYPLGTVVNTTEENMPAQQQPQQQRNHSGRNNGGRNQQPAGNRRSASNGGQNAGRNNGNNNNGRGNGQNRPSANTASQPKPAAEKTAPAAKPAPAKPVLVKQAPAKPAQQNEGNHRPPAGRQPQQPRQQTQPSQPQQQRQQKPSPQQPQRQQPAKTEQQSASQDYKPSFRITQADGDEKW